MPACKQTPPEDSRAAQAVRGKVLYEQYCLGCHGADGKGMIMDSMVKDPADLTTLVARRGGGEFPILEVARIIDGRKMIANHGSREMPVWGDIFTQEGEITESEIKGRLAEIIAYLMSIQN